MGHTILLADDSITIQKVIELTFSDEDFTLHTVGNGQKAIEEIRAVKPDIVLCDIIMPEKNGYEVCEFIKTADDLRHIPVLLLTGAFEPFDQDRAKKAGCDGFLAKPFEPQTLISKVKELLASAGAQPAPAEPARAVPEMPAAPARPKVEPTPAPSMETPTVEVPSISEPPAPPASPVKEPPPPPPAPPEPMSAPPTPAEPPEPAPSIPEPSTPMPSMEDEGATIMADHFAVEAGEKELSVEPGDQTVLLGEDETPTVPSEDIWKEVQKGPQAVAPPAASPTGAPVDESATVYLSPTEEQAPPPTEEPSFAPPEPVVGGGFDDFAAPPPDAGTPPLNDDVWVLPSTDEPPEPQPAEPELTPLGDFGGFDDFSSSESKGEEPAPPSPEHDLPGRGMDEEPSPFEVSETPMASETPIGFGIPAEPEPPFPRSETPIEAGGSLSDLPMSPESELAEAPQAPGPETPPFKGPASVEEPTPFVEPSSMMESPAEMTPPVEASPVMDLSPEPTPPVGEPMLEPPGSPTTPQEPVSSPSGPAQSPTVPPVTSLETEAMPQDVDALVEQIAERVVAKLSDKVIKELAWEVVPDMAETLIQKEIDALKAKIPK